MNTANPHRVLITGGAGFIGSRLAAYFQGRAEVRVLDNLRTGSRDHLVGCAHEFIHGSVLDAGAVRAAVAGVDQIFHLAALVSVQEAAAQPEECFAINHEGTRRLLEAAAVSGVKKLVHASTCAIYGDHADGSYIETALPAAGLAPYAASKLAAEHECARFTAAGKIPTVCLRYFNVFGPRQKAEGAYAAAVPKFIQRALNHEPVVIYGDGRQTRDFIFVDDVVAATAHLGAHPVTGVVNVGAGQSTSIKTLAEEILRLTASRSALEFAPALPGEIRHSIACVKKLHAAGFRPQITLTAGLRATADSFLPRQVPTNLACPT